MSVDIEAVILLKMDQPHVTYTVSQKICPHFNFLNNCKKLTDFNDFWFVKS